MESISTCKEFDADILYNWNIKGTYGFTTDTFLTKLTGKYQDCILGKDSGYIIKTLGRIHFFEAPAFPNSDSLHLKYAIIFIVRTPKNPKNSNTNNTINESQYYNGYELRFGLDSANIIRCLNILTTGIEGKP
jgi:hypothetical protein